ncbi:hypothetical protein HYY69_03415 [Candidatus Woesearchaeota archaeon]|nr:hypothetical protein [Candidatus Woesearchaeota archaeon]
MEIDNKRLITALSLVFILGILFAIVNGVYTSDTNQQLPIIVYVISFISLLIGATVVIMFQMKLTKMQLENILKILPREERLIIKILLDNNKNLEQNKIVALSGFSKVQVSRTIQKLVERGVVEKKILGNTNLLILKI